MVPQLAEVYQKEHPHLEFEIAAEGSSSCFTNLLAGTCDFGMSSRKIKESERKKLEAKGINLTEHIAAYNMIAIVVDEKNPLTSLSREQVKGIFTSKITTWKELGWKTENPIKVLTRNTSSGTYKTFQKLAMDREPYGKTTEKVPSNEVILWLAGLKADNGISYCGIAYTSRLGIKPLKVDGIFPAPENVQTYPLTRNLYFYSTEATSSEAKAFIQWTQTSEEAAKVIEKVGFIAGNKKN